MKLVYDSGKTITRKGGGIVRTGTNDTPVLEGDTVQDFRGDTFQVEGMTPPHKPSSTGRVTVRECHGNGELRVDVHEQLSLMSFFPGVIGAHWVP